MVYCPPNELFQCRYDECISWSLVCDGKVDCSNSADENCDTCINDLYLCRDSSRINCSWACSILGFIPCKSYRDKKVCSTVLKDFDLSIRTGSINDSTISTEALYIIAVLGSTFLITISILIVMLGFLHKRFRQRHTEHNQSVNQSTSEIESRLRNISNTNNNNNNNILNKDYNNFMSTPKNTRKSFKKDSYSDNKSDYSQLYSGELPPSYKVAKYLPNAVTTNSNNSSNKENDKNCISTSSTNQYIHIYENIDDNYLNNNLILSDNKSNIFENNIINIKTDCSSISQ